MITVVILIALQKKYMQTVLGRWSLVLIAAGALGNAIDRVAHGFVVDLFDFRLIHFPVFNVADIFICIGGGAVCDLFYVQHKDKQPKMRTTTTNRDRRRTSLNESNELQLTAAPEDAGKRIDSCCPSRSRG